jgi:hypothetical protein
MITAICFIAKLLFYVPNWPVLIAASSGVSIIYMFLAFFIFLEKSERCSVYNLLNSVFTKVVKVVER